MLKIGAIGYGNRISGVIKILMSFDEDIKISAISDLLPYVL